MTFGLKTFGHMTSDDITYSHTTFGWRFGPMIFGHNIQLHNVWSKDIGLNKLLYITRFSVFVTEAMYFL